MKQLDFSLLEGVDSKGDIPPQLYMICGKLRFESALNRQASLRRAVALNRLAV